MIKVIIIKGILYTLLIIVVYKITRYGMDKLSEYLSKKDKSSKPYLPEYSSKKEKELNSNLSPIKNKKETKPIVNSITKPLLSKKKKKTPDFNF
jgi:hypothetical protein